MRAGHPPCVGPGHGALAATLLGIIMHPQAVAHTLDGNLVTAVDDGAGAGFTVLVQIDGPAELGVRLAAEGDHVAFGHVGVEDLAIADPHGAEGDIVARPKVSHRYSCNGRDKSDDFVYVIALSRLTVKMILDGR